SPHINEWRERIHPDDREHALAELETHLDGRTTALQSEYRLRHKDGSYRWVLSRGTAIRNAAGRAYRMVGLHTDVSARKHLQDAVREIAQALSASNGMEFFRNLVRNFATVLGTREAFVCECCNFPTTRMRILAYWADGKFGEPCEFDLAGTSCEDVIVDGKTLYYPSGVGERWPLEKLYNRDSYFGIPFFNSAGIVIGHIACMDPKPMPQELPHKAVFEIFAARAGSELDRIHAARSLFEERSRHQALLGSLKEGVIIAGATGKVEYLNPAAVQITGWSPDEATGVLLETIFKTSAPPATGVSAQSEFAQAVGAAVLADEVSLTQRGGTECRIVHYACPVSAATGELLGSVVIFHRVAPREAAQAALAH
ncbi:MAG: PAS domain-containing protein, partial [Burkholderiales bacterium]